MADGFDTSIYRSQPGYNPLGMLGQFATIQNQLTQGALLQQQLRFKNAVGKHLQGNVDPETGLPNAAKAFASMAGDPDAAPFAVDFLQHASQANMTTHEAALAELNTSWKREDAIGNALASILPKKYDMKPSDWSDVLTSLPPGMVPPPMMAKIMARVAGMNGRQLYELSLQRAT